MDQVGYFMNKKVVSVHPETPLVDAARILFTDKFSGLPVIDKKHKVLGILTEYDLLTKGTQVHLPTLMKLLKEFDLYRKDKSLIRDELKGILSMQVKEVMNKEPLTLLPSTTVEEATKTFAEHHRVNPIPIIDGEKKLVGILSRHDLIKMYAGKVPSFRLAEPERSLDGRINNFLKSFEADFVIVSKFRTRFWPILSIAFAIVGFIIAFSLILTIRLK